MTEPDSNEPSRSARIWKRTVVGLSIGGFIIYMLVLAAQSEAGMPIAIVASLLTIGAAWEVAYMGSLRERRLGFALIGPLAAAVFFSVAHVSYGRDAGYSTSLINELLIVTGLAAFGLAGARLLKKRRSDNAFTFLGFAATLILLAYLIVDITVWDPSVAHSMLLTGCAAVSVYAAYSVTRFKKSDLRWALGLALWIALPLTWVWHVWSQFGPAPMVGLVVLSKVGDIAAYYGGNAFGKHHPLPNLSPGKTVEGFACSVAAGILTGGILSAVDAFPCGLLAGVTAGLVVNIASQAGDLLESWVKRSVGVKDSSAVFGPSGGFLDIVDSLLLSAPAALLTWPWLLLGDL